MNKLCRWNSRLCSPGTYNRRHLAPITSSGKLSSSDRSKFRWMCRSAPRAVGCSCAFSPHPMLCQIQGRRRKRSLSRSRVTKRKTQATMSRKGRRGKRHRERLELSVRALISTLSTWAKRMLLRILYCQMLNDRKALTSSLDEYVTRKHPQKNGNVDGHQSMHFRLEQMVTR